MIFLIVDVGSVIFNHFFDKGAYGFILFFHFLVMGPALSGSSGFHELRHNFKDFEHSSVLFSEEDILMIIHEDGEPEFFPVGPMSIFEVVVALEADWFFDFEWH